MKFFSLLCAIVVLLTSCVGDAFTSFAASNVVTNDAGDIDAVTASSIDASSIDAPSTDAPSIDAAPDRMVPPARDATSDPWPDDVEIVPVPDAHPPSDADPNGCDMPISPSPDCSLCVEFPYGVGRFQVDGGGCDNCYYCTPFSETSYCSTTGNDGGVPRVVSSENVIHCARCPCR